MPSQEKLNPSARVRSYPVVERYRFVWVWPGDPALADPTLVPDMHWNDDPEWEGDGKTMLAKCDYRLLVDNLMDLTHEIDVHVDQHRKPARRGSAADHHAQQTNRDLDALDAGHRRTAVLARQPASPATSIAGR